MLRITKPYLFGALAAALILAAWAAAGRAGDQADAKAAKDGDAPKNHRLLYLVKHGSAKDLAAALADHFKGDAEFKALPDAVSNGLLINAASDAALDEVVKLLGQLDKRPQVVAVEVLVADVAVRKDGGDKPKPGDGEKADAEQWLDEKDFTGTIEDVNAKVEAARKKGAITGVKRIQLTAVEGQPASAMVGDNKPFVVGVTTTGTGAKSRNITYRNIGLNANVTARVSPDKTVTVDLKFEDIRTSTPEDAPQLGTDENGTPIRAAEFITATLNDKLSIPSGRAVAAHGVKTTSKTEKAQTLVIVSARVVDPDAKPEK
jgi:hypothetical protein